MREQGRLGEIGTPGASRYRRGDARERAEQRLVLRQGQRYQRRAGLDHLEPEAAGEIIGEAGRAELGDGRAAGRDHQSRRGRAMLPIVDAELAVGMIHVADRVAQMQRHAAGRAFIEQHRHDLAGRAVAEELPQSLFVPGDAVALDEREEVRGRVAAQRRAREMRIGADEAFGDRVHIGEVAAPAPRDQDLAAGFGRMIDDEHAPSALPRDRGAHQPRAAGAEDDCVKGGGRGRHHRAVARYAPSCQRQCARANALPWPGS